MLKDDVTFKDILKVYPDESHDEGTLFTHLCEVEKRQLAVVAALELIKADVSSSFSTGGTCTKTSYALEQHMNHLAEYADCILNAMNGSEQD